MEPKHCFSRYAGVLCLPFLRSTGTNSNRIFSSCKTQVRSVSEVLDLVEEGVASDTLKSGLDVVGKNNLEYRAAYSRALSLHGTRLRVCNELGHPQSC